MWPPGPLSPSGDIFYHHLLWSIFNLTFFTQLHSWQWGYFILDCIWHHLFWRMIINGMSVIINQEYLDKYNKYFLVGQNWTLGGSELKILDNILTFHPALPTLPSDSVFWKLLYSELLQINFPIFYDQIQAFIFFVIIKKSLKS